MADPYGFKDFSGIVPWQFRPSYHSTLVNNPRRAMVMGSVMELLLMIGGALLLVGLILGLIDFDNNVINIVGYVMAGIGGVLFLSGFIICGGVIKHACCCRCGKPTLADLKTQWDEARREGKPFPVAVKFTGSKTSLEAKPAENAEPLVDKPGNTGKSEDLGEKQSQAEEGRI